MVSGIRVQDVKFSKKFYLKEIMLEKSKTQLRNCLPQTDLRACVWIFSPSMIEIKGFSPLRAIDAEQVVQDCNRQKTTCQ